MAGAGVDSVAFLASGFVSHHVNIVVVNVTLCFTCNRIVGIDILPNFGRAGYCMRLSNPAKLFWSKHAIRRILVCQLYNN